VRRPAAVHAAGPARRGAGLSTGLPGPPGSLIRFIEARFGVFEPNISAWRRQTCGDLTSAFRFGAPPARYPAGNTRLRLAAAEAALLTAQQEVNDNPLPVPPAVNEPLPKQ
jgi:phospholipase C